jgi:hypothetical protein
MFSCASELSGEWPPWSEQNVSWFLPIGRTSSVVSRQQQQWSSPAAAGFVWSVRGRRGEGVLPCYTLLMLLLMMFSDALFGFFFLCMQVLSCFLKCCSVYNKKGFFCLLWLISSN